MSHTPGPWKVDPDNMNVFAKGLLAQTYGHVHNGERRANAYLIAAAPEMLKALEKVETMVKSLIGPNLGTSDWACVTKAISKARGEL